MKSEPVETVANVEPVAPVPAEHEDIRNARETLTRYGVPLLLALLAAGLVIGGAYGFRTWRASRTDRAAEALARANSFNELEAVVSDYASTPSAPLALLRVAKAYYDQGNFDLALAKYDAFLASYGKHPQVLAAGMGRLHVLEAQGQVESALAGFAAFARDNPEHYLASQAIFGQIRCLDRLDRVAEAKALCEDFIAAQDPESGWMPRAEETMQGLRRRLKAQPGSGAPQAGDSTRSGAAAPAALSVTSDATPDTAMPEAPVPAAP